MQDKKFITHLGGDTMTELMRILMSRDDMNQQDAESLIAEMREAVLDGDDPEEVLLDYGLEPDYIYDIL